MMHLDLAALASDFLGRFPAPGVHPRDLAAVLELARPIELAHGDALCREGERGEAMFWLVRGAVRVSHRDFKGQPRDLAVLAAPALVGHMALVDGSNRSASCIADGPAVALALDRAGFQRLTGEDTPRGAALRRVVLTSLARQLGAANRRVRGLLDAAVPDDPDTAELELRRISGTLDGWKLDDLDDSDVRVVRTDDDLRNPPRRR